MEPGMTPDQMAARLTQLRQDADQAMAHLQERTAAARRTQEQAAGTTGEATSGDGRVRAVVDMTGVVTSLTFAPSLFDSTTPDRLASTVVATIQAAAARARHSADDAVASLRTDDPRPQLRVGVPEAPSTAVDPTAARDDWHAAPSTTSPPSPSDEPTDRPW